MFKVSNKQTNKRRGDGGEGKQLLLCFVSLIKSLRFRLQEFRSFGGGPKSKLYSFVGGTLVLKFKFSLLPSVPSVRPSVVYLTYNYFNVAQEGCCC